MLPRSSEMALHASALCLAAIVAACATTVPERRSASRYPPKLVVRQEIALLHAPESALGKRPSVSPQTRYYLFAADGTVCQVNFVQYSAVKPDDWVICDWQLAPPVRTDRELPSAFRSARPPRPFHRLT